MNSDMEIKSDVNDGDHNCDAVVVDIKKDLDDIVELKSDTSIYRVPYTLRHAHEDAYTPKFVSIGPLHHGNKRLQPMEYHKKRYLKSLIRRSGKSLQELVDAVKRLEPRVRGSYSEVIELSPDELVKVILADAYFIVEIFWKYYKDEEDDHLGLNPNWYGGIMTDLVLLENQLPFFVLNELFDLALGDLAHPCSFLELAFFYFRYYNEHDFPTILDVLHFTDLLRAFMLPPPGRLTPRGDNFWKPVPSATELKEAGLKFKKSASDSFLIELSLTGKVLQIPQLRVESVSDVYFRNIVALEMCHYPYEAYFTDLMNLLDNLINTSTDVDFFVKENIIESLLGDRERVAKLFNTTCDEVVFSNCSTHYLRLCDDLNKFYTNPYNNCIATLRQDYCRNGWKTAASIGGIALLILTIIQTVCTVISIS